MEELEDKNYQYHEPDIWHREDNENDYGNSI